jgi:putative ABC transport system permease protein
MPEYVTSSAYFKLAAPGSDGWFEIIGVVGDTKMVSIEEQIRPAIYYPYSRTPYTFETVVVRTAGSPFGVTSSLIQAVRQLDAELPVSNMRPMTEVIARSLAQRRVVMALLAVFAAIALLLAAVGIYGVMAYMVSQRTQEIGIRMALGANRGGVIAMVFTHALRLAGIGLVCGLVAALALTGLLRAMLFDVRATDPLTFGLVAAALLAVASFAALLPALRATRIDPLTALRTE